MPDGKPLPRGSDGGPLTEQQRVALENIALIAEECARPRHRRRTPLGSVIVTVNAGYE